MPQTTTFSKNDNSISYIRFISMILIILCHFFQYYNHFLAWWLNIGVQIFFIISGFLYGSKTLSSHFLKRRFTKILIPYYCFLIPVILLHSILFNKPTLSSIVKLIFCIGTINGVEHLWFVGYILFCYLITPVLFLLKKRLLSFSLLKTSFLYLIIIIITITITTVSNFYFSAAKFICYVMGYFLSDLYQKSNYNFLKIATIVFGSLAIPITALRIYLKYFYSFSDNRLLKIFNFAEPYAHLLLGVFIFLLMYLLFKNFPQTPIINFFNKYSYSIYIVHHIFILGPFSLMEITNYTLINYCIVLISISISALALNFINSKITKYCNL